MNNQHQLFLDFALTTAKQAGDLILQILGTNKVNFKGEGKNNLVTQADLESEQFITKAITKAFPDHKILGEEFGETKNNSEYLWVIDPVDGTNNIAHGHPYFAVNIGLIHYNNNYDYNILVGVTHAPKLQETYHAIKNEGAYLNGNKIKVSTVNSLSESLLATGFPYDRKAPSYEHTFEMYKKGMAVSHGVRRMGAAALDLAYLACGRIDGFFEYSLKPWDIVPGILLVEEAGGKITNMDGTKIDINAENLLASNGKIHEEMEERIIRIRNENENENENENI